MMNNEDYFIYDICNRFKWVLVNDSTIKNIEYEIYKQLDYFGADLNKIEFKIKIVNDSIIMDISDINEYTKNIFLTPTKQLIRIKKLKSLF